MTNSVPIRNSKFFTVAVDFASQRLSVTKYTFLRVAGYAEIFDP